MNTILILSIVCLAVSCGANPTHRNATFIIGGTEAKSGEVPHIVSLQSYGNHGCGGSVLNSRTIITAAHCVDGMTASRLQVRVGSLQHNSGGQLIGITRIIMHSRYNSGTFSYDIALLITSSDIAIDGQAVKAVSLPTSELSAGTEVFLAGWGTRQSGVPSSAPINLHRVNVDMIGLEECKQFYKDFRLKVLDDMICAGVVGGGKDTCQGDSGGPLTSNGVQYGVVSWGNRCADALYPGVYANVFLNKDWINANKV